MVAFRHVLEADPAVTSLVRRGLRRWLAELHWPPEETDDLVMALNEAVANVVDHAYPDAAPDHYRPVHVLAEHQQGAGGEQRVLIEVTDSGGWRPIPANPGHRGRGLLMMRACTEALDIEPTPAGTRVTMTSRPVHQTPRPDPSNQTETGIKTGAEAANPLPVQRRRGDAQRA